MGADLELCAYRIVQEALTNISKHADAASCVVRLERRTRALIIIVEDDGKGMEVLQPLPQGGLGLMSIRERAARFGGAFRLERITNAGIRLAVEFPLPLQNVDGVTAAGVAREAPAVTTNSEKAGANTLYSAG
jgi:signal transduction histidine kinase